MLLNASVASQLVRVTPELKEAFGLQGSEFRGEILILQRRQLQGLGLLYCRETVQSAQANVV